MSFHRTLSIGLPVALSAIVATSAFASDTAPGFSGPVSLTISVGAPADTDGPTFDLTARELAEFGASDVTKNGDTAYVGISLMDLVQGLADTSLTSDGADLDGVSVTLNITDWVDSAPIIAIKPDEEADEPDFVETLWVSLPASIQPAGGHGAT
ncbi:MAG: hypothetical protein AAGF79_06400 [Pseudomonadota bacterium]